MPLPTIYSTGTASVANGGTTVTGVGTSWLGSIYAGDLFTDPAQGIFARVTADATSNTSLSINAWPGTALSGNVYEILITADTVRMQERTRQVLNALGEVTNTGIGIDAFGLFAGRTAHDAEIAGYVYLSTDGDGDAIDTPVVFIKNSATSADWSTAIPITGVTGATGDAAVLAWQGAWLTATAYAVNDGVSEAGASYVCIEAHTSGTFATDLAASKWALLAAKGDTGAAGSNGTNGTNGSDGADGKTVLNGTVAPTTEGVDGDFYINTATDEIYGPKTGGAWGSATSLVGPAGSNGTNGTNGTNGADGTNGTNGADGTDPGILLTWDVANDDSDPGTGKIKADNDALGSATLLYVDKANRAASSIAAFLLSLDDSTTTAKGTLTLTDTATGAQAGWTVTGVTDATGYVKVAVSGHFGATGFADTLPVSLQFSRTGDAGAGAVDSVNSQTGAVVLDADDIDDTSTTNKFATAAQLAKADYLTVTASTDLDTIRAKAGHISVTQAVDLDAIETRVNALDAAVILMGGWDASAGTFPGSGTAQAGASYIITVAGTVGGIAFSVNDRVLAITDNASTTTYAANWLKLDYTDQVLSVDGATGGVTVGAIIAAATGKTTPVDGDSLALSDSADSNTTKKLTWANLKATLKTYFDTLYQPLLATLTSWGAITRAAGFDTFAATPSSANLKTLVTDETGSGGALVFATSPTISGPTFTRAKIETVYTITDGAAFAVDPTNGEIQFVTLGANRTPVPANWSAGQTVTLRVADGTSAFTVTWSGFPIVWKGVTAPTLPTTGYAEISIEYSGGVYRGVHVGDFAS